MDRALLELQLDVEKFYQFFQRMVENVNDIKNRPERLRIDDTIKYFYTIV